MERFSLISVEPRKNHPHSIISRVRLTISWSRLERCTGSPANLLPVGWDDVGGGVFEMKGESCDVYTYIRSGNK